MTLSAPTTAALLALLSLTSTSCARGPVDDRLHLNGRIEAPLVDIAPRIQGRVLEVLVREGDRVKAGDLLVRLDLAEVALAPDRDAQSVTAAEARVRDLASGSRAAEIAGAEAERADRLAALSLAKEELTRQQQLRSKRVGTQRDLDRAASDVTRAQAAVDAATQRLTLVRQGFRQWQSRQAEAELGRAQRIKAQSDIVVREAELRAPSDAVVLHRLVEPGALLGPGQPALTLGLVARLYVRTFVPEPHLGQVRQGQVVQGEDHGGALGRILRQQVEGEKLGVRVEAGGRLVRDQQRRPGRQEAGQQHPGALTAGEIEDAPPFESG